jgi:sterol desaturase/sphingolipid hydroxylase (fatty acid hydroxylase superfamily)
LAALTRAWLLPQETAMIDLIADLLTRSLLWVYLVVGSVAVARFVIVAGGAWWALWASTPSRFAARRLRDRKPSRRQVKREIMYSLAACLMFPTSAFIIIFLGQHRLTQVYFYVSEHGWAYLGLSVVLMVFLHDALFYWKHRLLHVRWLMRNVHFRHHEFNNPSPWAAFAFHPVEGFLHSLSVVIIVCLIPAHPIALSIFLTLSVIANVYGHCGFEVLPDRFQRHWLGRSLNSPSLHGWHHCRDDKNFGLYFTFWDKLMRTQEQPAFDSIAVQTGDGCYDSTTNNR